MNRAKKLYFFAFSLWVLHKEIIILINYINRGAPERDGVLILGPHSEKTKTKLSTILNTQPFLFDMHSSKQHNIACSSIKIHSNNIYIVSYKTAIQSDLICDENSNSILESIPNMVDIPFYIRWLGYNALHVEILGNHFSTNESILKENLETMPDGSTLIVTAPSNNNLGLQTLSEEVILQNFISYIQNFYIRYVLYIITNPINNIFGIRVPLGVQLFKTDIDTLLSYDDLSVLKWQSLQIKLFFNFIIQNADQLNDKHKDEFLVFMEEFVKGNEGNNIVFLQLQLDHLARYKHLLAFSYLVENKAASLKGLCDSGVNVDSRLLDGSTLIYVASYLGNLEVVKLLLDLNANTNIQRENNSTALTVASWKGFADITILLLSNGADHSINDKDGRTPLIFASSKGHEQVVQNLIYYGANANHVANAKETALSLASSYKHFGVVEQLLMGGAIIQNGSDPILSLLDCKLGLYNKKQIDNILNILSLLVSYLPQWYNFESPEHEYSSNLMLEDHARFLVYYIMKNNHDAYSAAHNVECLRHCHGEDENLSYMVQARDCLLNLDFDKSYNGFVDVCGVSFL